MRSDIINALNYPRLIIQQDLSTDECIHALHFDANDKKCQDCATSEECLWLMKNDSRDALQQKPDAVLITALEFAAGYIDNHAMLDGHDEQNCKCESCHWLRSTNKLLEQVFSET